MIDPVLGHDTDKFLDVKINEYLTHRFTLPLTPESVQEAVYIAYAAGVNHLIGHHMPYPHQVKYYNSLPGALK